MKATAIAEEFLRIPQKILHQNKWFGGHDYKPLYHFSLTVVNVEYPLLSCHNRLLLDTTFSVVMEPKFKVNQEIQKPGWQVKGNSYFTYGEKTESQETP